MEQYILQSTGEEVNLAEDSNARFKAVQENTHVVVSYFDLRTQAYHEKVLKPVFGVSDYWYRYEFAKSRGQIHWHQLSWRDDRQPHQLLHEASRTIVAKQSTQLDLASGRMKTLP